MIITKSQDLCEQGQVYSKYLDRVSFTQVVVLVYNHIWRTREPILVKILDDTQTLCKKKCKNLFFLLVTKPVELQKLLRRGLNCWKFAITVYYSFQLHFNF